MIILFPYIGELGEIVKYQKEEEISVDYLIQLHQDLWQKEDEEKR